MTNEKRKEAIALKYDPEISKSPVILAKGKGKTAEKILDKGHETEYPCSKR